MKRGMIKSSFSLGVIAAVLTLNVSLNAFADSEASMHAGTEASSHHSGEANRQNSSSANAENSHSAQTSRTTNTRRSANQPGIRTVANSKHAARRHHSGSSSRSYMVNTIQQAARSK
jgi:hypothetical protein